MEKFITTILVVLFVIGGVSFIVATFYPSYVAEHTYYEIKVDNETYTCRMYRVDEENSCLYLKTTDEDISEKLNANNSDKTIKLTDGFQKITVTEHCDAVSEIDWLLGKGR